MRIPFTYYMEWACFLTSLLCYRRLRGTPFLWFIPYLLFTLVIESVGIYYSYLLFVKHEPVKNYYLFNIHNHFEVLVPVYMYYKTLKIEKTLKAIRWMSVVFLAFGIINITCIQGFYVAYNSYTFFLGTLIVTYLAAAYMYESLQLENINDNILQQPIFWMTVGYTFFFVGMSVVVLLHQLTLKLHLYINGKTLYYIVNQCVNVVLYSCLSIAFIISKPLRKQAAKPVLA